MPDRPHLPLQAVAAFLLAAACSGGETPPADCVPQTAPLAASDGWSITTAAEDPFDDRPDDPFCIPQAVAVEGPAVEIDTTQCSYVTLVQPTLVDVQACDVVRATLVHSPLIADEPAEAHFVFRFGGVDLFDRRIPIPSDNQIFELEHVPDAPVPAGTPIHVHVHNHGSNNWFVTDVRLGR